MFKSPINHGNEFIIAISTPLMSRVRKLYPEEAKMVFVDSTGSLDISNVVVTLFVIATNVGALPVGITIGGSKSEECYTVAFTMLKIIL